MAYQYKMVQAPPNIRIQMKGANGTEAATYLQGVVDDNVRAGWEFYRVDSLGVTEEPGCLASLLGQKAIRYAVYVITFRKGTP